MTAHGSSQRKLPDDVVRFGWWPRIQHAFVILLFLALMITGLPQKWPHSELSRQVIDLVGGIFTARWIHRFAGWTFGGLAAVHLTVVIYGIVARRIEPSLLLARQDFVDAVESIRYYLGRSTHPPRFDRFDFKQKFEYWGMIFGSLIMVFTGLVLIFPVHVSRWLPAELIPAAKALHSNEAMLALVIILVWHIYGALLSPEVFPADTSIFTGKISRTRLRHEHPIEYERLFPQDSAGGGPERPATH